MFLGIDFGTSGCRAVVIDRSGAIHAEAALPLPAPQRVSGRIEQSAHTWSEALARLFTALAKQLDLASIQRLAIDGTSGTLLLCSQHGEPLTPALMYNDASSAAALQQLIEACPDRSHLCLNVSSALARAVQLCTDIDQPSIHILHQADFLANRLAGRWGVSDYHNALKLGFDPVDLRWPQWVRALLPSHALPQVLAPGQSIGRIDPAMAQQFGFSSELEVCAGSTDANAAFIATGSTHPGDAVTSLGSTLVLKLLSDIAVNDLTAGIYSHRLGDYWLVGGASNAGGAVLKSFFSNKQLAQLSAKMDLAHPTGLDFYPLPAPGERFPLYDPDMQPRLSPRPDSDATFLQGMLEALTRIEKTGYDRLAQLGAAYPSIVRSSGGGAQNPQWMEMRRQRLGITVQKAEHTEACYGSALLALHGLDNYKIGNVPA